jgi:hypothetical protein
MIDFCSFYCITDIYDRNSLNFILYFYGSIYIININEKISQFYGNKTVFIF